jgi:hypothetical protein
MMPTLNPICFHTRSVITPGHRVTLLVNMDNSSAGPLDPFNIHKGPYFTLSQLDGIRRFWIGTQEPSRYLDARCPAAVIRDSFFQKHKAERHGTTSQTLFILPLPPSLYFPPISLSLPCLSQSTPLPTLPLHFLGFQLENCPPFRKFGLGRFGSAFSPTAAWLGRTGMDSRHLKANRVQITKSKRCYPARLFS